MECAYVTQGTTPRSDQPTHEQSRQNHVETTFQSYNHINPSVYEY